MSERSPRFNSSFEGRSLFFRIAMRSTTPRHSASMTRKETNFQRAATRELRARKMISAHRPVACALTCAGVAGLGEVDTAGQGYARRQANALGVNFERRNTPLPALELLLRKDPHRTVLLRDGSDAKGRRAIPIARNSA